MGKKLQPKLRFKGFTDDWEQRRLGEIATVVGGGTPDTNNPLYWNGDINWFTPAEIGSNAYASKSERRITEEGLEHSSAKLLPAGRTILFTSRASIGLTAILTVDACTNQGFQSLVVSDRTDVFFLFGLCNQIKTQAIRNAAGSTFIEISGKQLAKIPLQIPSLDEQRRIGKIVRTIDSLIAAEKRKLDLLQKKKTALLRQIFEQKLRFKGYNNPWEQRRLGEIATVVGGGTPDTNNPLYWNGDINWFTPAEIGSNAYASKSERRITEEGLEHSSAKLLPAGRTILFTSRASIGLTAILTVDACTNQGFQSLVVSDRTDVFFLFGLCNQIKTQAIRNAAGSTFIEISGKQLAKIPLQIPSLDEQRRIGKIVRTMDSLIAVATRKIDLLTLKKKALLHQMFV